MPKIIENVREQLLAEAKRQIIEYGYAKTTIRSVAGACGLAIGTVYNYFPSKEMLVAAFVLEDWKKYLDIMAGIACSDPKERIRGIYGALCEFEEKNHILFSDADAAKVIGIGFTVRHKMLREQIAAFLLPVCGKGEPDGGAFAANFLSEALINWSMEKTDFDTLYSVIEKIIK